ncbi:MAG: flagellar biosynthesis protein FlhA [Candidatus Tectomicrobia bacterium]|nr:flagellar biosynthesis protein FlhA [Candidatus Tectomicrobia bacterium]
MAEKVGVLKGLGANYSDLFLAVGVVGILTVMLFPLPTLVLDLLLTLNITASLLTLLIALYVAKPLDFAVFPTLLLVMTLFRLSLNVASTRLILLQGHEGPGAAGEIIRSFGGFVVGGSYVVGMVVFLILVVINFVVITKGSGRIAEVAARFTLDAMPGKQMSIDADLNAGMINEAEARRRRRSIEEEADFYGAMDGASKFVRGDAIAGIVITLVNILGGFIIGVLQRGMTASSAAQTYALLTVGDGLVSQIPALIVSTAAGLVVTRAANESELGRELFGQVWAHPKAAGVAAALLALFGVMPGLPTFSFLVVATVMGGVAFLGTRSKRRSEEKVRKEQAAQARVPERMEALLPIDPLGLEIGYGLIPLVDTEQGGDLLDRIKALRRQFTLDMGFIVPPLHIQDNLQLRPGEYGVFLKGVKVASGELHPGRLLALDSGVVETPVKGTPTRDPAFGLPALWIEETDRARAEMARYTVVDHSTLVATHISEVIKSHAHELVGRGGVQGLVDSLREREPKAVEGVVPDLIPLGTLQRVLQNLLQERVSVRDLQTILECLTDRIAETKDPDALSEYVRSFLGRNLVRSYAQPDGTLMVMTFDPKLEEILAKAAEKAPAGSPLPLDPPLTQRLITSLEQAGRTFVAKGVQPVFLCASSIRLPLKRLTERVMGNLAFLAYTEVPSTAKIESLGMVRVMDAG